MPRYAEVAPATWVNIWEIKCPFCDYVSWMEKSGNSLEENDVSGALVKHMTRQHADILDAEPPDAASSPADASPSTRTSTTSMIAQQQSRSHMDESEAPLASSASTEAAEEPEIPSRIEPGRKVPPPPRTAEDWESAAMRLGAAGPMFEWTETGLLIAAEALLPYIEASRVDFSSLTAAEVGVIEHFVDNFAAYAPHLRPAVVRDLAESARPKVTGLPAGTPAEFILIAVAFWR